MKVAHRLIRLAPAGTSDVIGILPGGRFLAIETKAPRGKLTAAQQAFLTAVHEAGGVAVVVRDLVTLVRVLDDLEDDPLMDVPMEDL